MRNSTIMQKVGECEVCGKKGPLTKKRCNYCYWNAIKLKSVEKQQEREIVKEGLSDVIADLDAVYSRYLRLKAADKAGVVSCYTCGGKLRYQDAHCSHFIGRAHLYLRWDSRNTVVACRDCNIGLQGNIKEYAKRLNLQSPGLVQILQEESHIIFKPSISELKEKISEYSIKLKQLQNEQRKKDSN